ncbi:2'-5' RNA ligase [alpha proteobacterium BAL199]|jgi:RNA 2',3'-cyclic 3'-phosphodiesterase|nr:2'-5' RNA ligase [alpha proteobacterium BAL199]
MRLFVAIAMPEAVADPLCDLQGGLDGARWVDPDDFHLTLRFIGDVDRGTADDLVATLSSLHAPAFDLRLSGLGHFGSGHRLRALWAGVEPQPALTLLHGRVESAARRAGLPPEGRRFVPHVTLARMSGPISDDSASHWIGSRSPFVAGPFPVREVVLFESFLGREGPHYERRLVVPLDRLPDADDWDGEWDGPEPA